MGHGGQVLGSPRIRGEIDGFGLRYEEQIPGNTVYLESDVPPSMTNPMSTSTFMIEDMSLATLIPLAL